MHYLRFYTAILLLFFSCHKEDNTANELKLAGAFMGTSQLNLAAETADVPIDQSISLVFSAPLASPVDKSAIVLKDDTGVVDFQITSMNDTNTLLLFPSGLLKNSTLYTLLLTDQIKGKSGGGCQSIELTFRTVTGALLATDFRINEKPVSERPTGVSLNPSFSLRFNQPIKPGSITSSTISLRLQNQSVSTTFLLNDNNTLLTIEVSKSLEYLSKYTLTVSNQLTGARGEKFAGLSQVFHTDVDSNPKFPLISDDALLTLAQQQTFKYFYDFAHPASGMARERNTSGDLVTSGGSGFGVMALIVGIERGFISRAQGVERLDRILDFLETSDRYHGAWPHWINGNSGKVIPFSTNDNGADLVETAFMVQGLITMRQYLNSADSGELMLINRINTLWQTVEWDWFTRDGQNVFYWHWSPDKQWAMNMQINGYNEALIVYTLAAASPTHTISAAVYNSGWARNGAIKNNKLFYNIKLPVGYDYGGPLFFAHYSFLGLNPKNLSDQYANYWEQNVNHTLINRAYCIANPKNFVGYSSSNWGLTASDNQSGYSAHSPTNDLGVISPAAALSSMPYTPTESMNALKFFYYTMGDRLWGDYGFYDAFNVTEGWVANSYLAIDQGPIIIMIENHRTGLLWDLFMSAPEVQAGLTKLGFSY